MNNKAWNQNLDYSKMLELWRRKGLKVGKVKFKEAGGGGGGENLKNSIKINEFTGHKAS